MTNEPTDKEISSKKRRALFLVNLSAGLDGCDDQMLPASFRALETELHFTPKMLGHISMIQSLTLSLFCPIWGYVSDRVSRRLVLGFGCFMWGVATLLLSGADSYEDILILRALNGCFMAVIGPVSQSVLADYSTTNSRGFMFGLVQLTSNAGRVIGGVLITSLGTVIMFGSIVGWRFLIAMLGLISICVGGLIIVFMPSSRGNRPASVLSQQEQRLIAEYHERHSEGGTGALPTPESAPTMSFDTAFLRDVIRSSLGRTSMILVIAEGFLGCIPWNGLAFATMFYQYCGLSDLAAGISTGCMLLGGMIGGPLGGYIGDLISRKWSAAHGRPLMAQISMLLRLPILYTLFVILPRRLPNQLVALDRKEELSGGSLSSSTVASAHAPYYIFMLLSLALGMSSFAGAAVNRPIMTDVVLPEHRATAFAIVIAIEGVCSAFFGAPLVGYLAERRFGYNQTFQHISEMDPTYRTANARALAHAMAFVTIIPWIISFFIYSLLHFTLAKDLRDSHMLARTRSLYRANIPGLRPAMRSSSVTSFLQDQLAN